MRKSWIQSEGLEDERMEIEEMVLGIMLKIGPKERF